MFSTLSESAKQTFSDALRKLGQVESGLILSLREATTAAKSPSEVAGVEQTPEAMERVKQLSLKKREAVQERLSLVRESVKDLHEARELLGAMAETDFSCPALHELWGDILEELEAMRENPEGRSASHICTYLLQARGIRDGGGCP